jgi:hypothetical protein
LGCRSTVRPRSRTLERDDRRREIADRRAEDYSKAVCPRADGRGRSPFCGKLWSALRVPGQRLVEEQRPCAAVAFRIVIGVDNHGVDFPDDLVQGHDAFFVQRTGIVSVSNDEPSLPGSPALRAGSFTMRLSCPEERPPCRQPFPILNPIFRNS